MSQKIYTFSVSEREAKTVALLEKVKHECKTTGQSFSFVVIQALKQYTKASQ